MRDVMGAHWRDAGGAADEDREFTVGLKITFDRGAQPTKLKVNCRVAKTICHDIASEVEDSRRQLLLRAVLAAGIQMDFICAR